MEIKKQNSLTISDLPVAVETLTEEEMSTVQGGRKDSEKITVEALLAYNDDEVIDYDNLTDAAALALSIW